jgi:hypothetical protein
MIQAQSLEGRRFYVHAWGMSMTSRRSYEPELMQVVEDIDRRNLFTFIVYW